MTLADEHVVPDADDVGHEGHHVGGLADGLAVGDLGLLLVQILHLQAQQIAGRGEGEAGAGGVVAEEGDAQAGVKNPGGDVALPEVPQGVGHREHRLQLIGALVPRPVEVLPVHALDVERFQTLRKLGYFAHPKFPSGFYVMSLPVSSARN